MKRLIYIFMILLFFSCGNSEKKKFTRLVSYWQNREILFPTDTSFISYSRKWGERKVYLQKGKYVILNYVDSMGCMSCKLQLPEWREFIFEVDSMSHGTVPFVFVFQSKVREDLIHYLRKTGFDYPVYIDEKNGFGQLNGFSSNMQLQTFLLNQHNKVIAIGNPVHNFKVKELYLKIIQGEISGQTKEAEAIMTEVAIDKTSISLGRFNWQKEQKATFSKKNTGNRPLAVQDVDTSCGCTSVSYSKEPVQPGGELKLGVTYTAEHPEHFNKTITVYCNMESSPLVLKIMGDAE